MPVSLFKALQSVAGDDQLKTASENAGGKKKVAHQPEMGTMPNAGTQIPIGEALGRGPGDVRAILKEKAEEAAGAELAGRTWDDPREVTGARGMATSPGRPQTFPTRSPEMQARVVNELPKGAPTQFMGTKMGGFLGKMKGKATSMAGKARSGAANLAGKAKVKGRAAADTAAVHVRKHSKKYLAGGVAAGAAGGYAAGRRKKHASFAEYMTLIAQGEEGVKVASENIPAHEVAEHEIDRLTQLYTGVKLAGGTLHEAAAHAASKAKK